MFVDGTQFSSWLWPASVARAGEQRGGLMRTLSFLPGARWACFPGSLCVLVRARRALAAGAGPLAHPAHLSSRPGTRPQPMPAAEPALPDGTGETRGPGGCQRERGVWLQAGPPGCKAASGMGLGHLRDAARDAATTSTCVWARTHRLPSLFTHSLSSLFPPRALWS